MVAVVTTQVIFKLRWQGGPKSDVSHQHWVGSPQEFFYFESAHHVFQTGIPGYGYFRFALRMGPILNLNSLGPGVISFELGNYE